jgi:hypothetical protein
MSIYKSEPRTRGVPKLFFPPPSESSLAGNGFAFSDSEPERFDEDELGVKVRSHFIDVWKTFPEYLPLSSQNFLEHSTPYRGPLHTTLLISSLLTSSPSLFTISQTACDPPSPHP